MYTVRYLTFVTPFIPDASILNYIQCCYSWYFPCQTDISRDETTGSIGATQILLVFHYTILGINLRTGARQTLTAPVNVLGNDFIGW